MKREYAMLILLVTGIVIIGIYYTIDEIMRNRCYNMPINQYVEDKACEKYTFEEYMEEHYGS